MADTQMADLQDLYQRVILDHYRNPRNFRKPDQANRHVDGQNPLCGDNLSLYVEIEDGVLKDIGFTGTGCAIFIASASMMTESVKGRTREEIIAIYENFHQLVGNSPGIQPNPATIGKLAAFSGVRGYPARIRCALLAWSTLLTALQ